MNARLPALCVGLTLLAFSVHAGTELRLWHTYTPPSGESHHAFVLANYKRGIFIGSCGPSTRSLRWSYSIDMKGAGPRFTAEQIEIKDEAALEKAPVPAAAGEIVVDEQKKTLQI